MSMQSRPYVTHVRPRQTEIFVGTKKSFEEAEKQNLILRERQFFNLRDQENSYSDTVKNPGISCNFSVIKSLENRLILSI